MPQLTVLSVSAQASRQSSFSVTTYSRARQCDKPKYRHYGGHYFRKSKLKELSGTITTFLYLTST